MESYYASDAFSFDMRNGEVRAGLFPVKAITTKATSFASHPKQCAIPGVRMILSGCKAMTANVIRETGQMFCRRHKGVAVIMRGTSAREPDPALVNHFCRSNRSLVACSNEFDCIQAASINALALPRWIKGYHRATSVRKKHSFHLSKLG